MTCDCISPGICCCGSPTWIRPPCRGATQDDFPHVTGHWQRADLTFAFCGKKLVHLHVFVIEDDICVTGDDSQHGDTDMGYSIRGRASRDVHDRFENMPFFSATWLLIVTWHNVTFYGAASRPYPVHILHKQYLRCSLPVVHNSSVYAMSDDSNFTKL